MVLKVAIPGKIQFKMVHRDQKFLMTRQGDIHYIGGAEVLPPPLESEKENEIISDLGTEYEDEAKSILIEHNLRLVVYIAKKFDNTGVGVEDLISIGTIGLIKSINTFNPGKNIKLATYASRCIEREQTIIRLRFGIGNADGKELTQKEVAELLGISQSYISRLEKKIMRRLKKEMSKDN